MSISISIGFKWYWGCLPVLKIKWQAANTNKNNIATYAAIGDGAMDLLLETVKRDAA